MFDIIMKQHRYLRKMNLKSGFLNTNRFLQIPTGFSLENSSYDHPYMPSLVIMLEKNMILQIILSCLILFARFFIRN